MFYKNFLQNNNIFYSSNFNSLIVNNRSNFELGGGNKILSYKRLCRNFNINNMTTSSSFRYNYL